METTYTVMIEGEKWQLTVLRHTQTIEESIVEDMPSRIVYQSFLHKVISNDEKETINQAEKVKE